MTTLVSIMPYAIVVVLLALASIGFAGLRAVRSLRGNGSVEYFLGGRAVPWRTLTGSFFVTSLWAVWCTGVEMGFRSEVWLWTGLGLSMAVGFIFTAVVLVPAYREGETLTLPSLIAERTENPGLGTVLSVSFILLTSLVQIPITIVLGGKMMQLIFGWDPVTAGLLIIVVPGVFAVAGGYTAVFAVQNVASIAAVAGLVFFGSTGALDMTLPVATLAGGAGTDAVVLIIVIALVGFWSAGFDQSMLQRVKAAPSVTDPRRAAIAVAGALAIAGLAIGIGSASRVAGILPSDGWARIAAAFVGTSLLVAAMGALAGCFMSVSTIVTMDIVTRFRSSADESALVLSGRLMTTVIVVFSILASSLLAFLGDAVVVWLVVAYGVFGPPLAVTTLVGILWPGRRATAMLWGLSAGWIMGAGWAIHQADHMNSQSSVLWTALLSGSVTALVTSAIVLLITPAALIVATGVRKSARASK
jgi:Na+/proline symporter